jgi:DNA-binding transcriptional ArsR family regulator
MNFFKVMAHQLRLQILESLCKGPKSVTEPQYDLNSGGSTVSRHLAVLKAKKLVFGTKDKNRTIYAIQDPLIHDLFNTTKSIFYNQLREVISSLSTEDKE